MTVTSFVEPGSGLYGEKLEMVAAQTAAGKLAKGVMLVDADGAPVLSASGAVLIGNNRNKIRDEFPPGGLNPALWDVISTGAGMTVTTGNGSTGSYLRIQSGVTSSSETILRTKEIFTLPVRLAAFVTASQRIIDQEFFLELLEVTREGAPVVVAASQTNAGVWRNHASAKLDGVSATAAFVTVRSGGAPEFVSASSTITTTAATGVDPNFFPAGYIELHVTGEHVALIPAPIDSLVAPSVARRITQAAPDPAVFYKLQIRARNLATAPASNTDWRVHAIRLFDYTRTTVEVIGGPGYSAGSMAVPVTALINGNPNVVGAAAHDAAVTGNPVLMGGEARTTNAAVSASGDTVRLMATMLGALVVKPYAIPESTIRYAATAGGITGTTDVAAFTAAPAGVRNYVTSMQLRNAGTVATEFVIKDGASVIWRDELPANMATSIPFTFPDPLRGSAATALNIACITTGAKVFANLQGHLGP